MKNITQSLKLITLALVLSVGISYVSAWTAPTVTPPGGNVAAPLNTGDNVQYKTGTLVLNDNSTNPFINGLIVRYGNVGIGTTNPTQKLDVLGGNIAARVADSTSRVGFVAQSNYGQAVIFSGGGHGAGMGFYTDSISAAGPTDAKMVIKTGTGNVGIGTAVPAEKLEVAGNIKASGDVCNGTTCLSAVGSGVPSGTLCGSFQNDTMWGSGWSAFAQCQGMNGWSGCPAGYTFRVTSYDQYSGAANYFYSCVKN